MARLTAPGGDTAGADATGGQLDIANALWAQRGLEFRPTFLDVQRTHYDAGLHEVDFAAATEQARRRINGWVADHTRDRIQELIPPGVLDRATLLLLTNAHRGDRKAPDDQYGQNESSHRSPPLEEWGYGVVV